MALTLGDILDQFRYEVDSVPGLAGVYCTYSIQPVAKVHLWTFLDRRDRSAERALASAEGRLRASFTPVKFDFTTVHLQGRDPAQFIPEGAINVPVAVPAREKALRYGS